MPLRELNNHNAAKRMTDFLGHSSTSEASSSITNNFATLSNSAKPEWHFVAVSIKNAGKMC